MSIYGRPAAIKKKALEADMRSAVIVMLFLFSMLFLGAQAAQMDPLNTVEEASAGPAQHVDAGLVQSVAY